MSRPSIGCAVRSPGQAPAPATAPGARSRWLGGHVPGEPGVWALIFADMVVFTVFFAVFLIERSKDPALFAESRAAVNVAAGALNTLVLLSSSLLVVLGVHAAQRGARLLAGRLFAGATLCGLVFLLVKVVEYGQKFAGGITPGTDNFFLYFFILTGIHAFHVCIGLVGLMVARHVVRRPRPTSHGNRVIEVAASFWHMVDLLWIVLFPLLYLAS